MPPARSVTASASGTASSSESTSGREQLEKFFADPKLQKFIGSIRAEMSNATEISVTEATESPDQS